jgi:hypothetical protein
MRDTAAHRCALSHPCDRQTQRGLPYDCMTYGLGMVYFPETTHDINIDKLLGYPRRQIKKRRTSIASSVLLPSNLLDDTPAAYLIILYIHISLTHVRNTAIQ